MISSTQSCCPRTTGNGWNIQKMHILTRMIPNMLKFGAAEIFSGQHGERFLMSAVKDLSSNTRRQYSSYVQELASRVWETEIIDTVYHRGVVPYLDASSCTYGADCLLVLLERSLTADIRNRSPC